MQDLEWEKHRVMNHGSNPRQTSYTEAEEYGLPQIALILFPIFDTAKPQ